MTSSPVYGIEMQSAFNGTTNQLRDFVHVPVYRFHLNNISLSGLRRYAHQHSNFQERHASTCHYYSSRHCCADWQFQPLIFTLTRLTPPLRSPYTYAKGTAWQRISMSCPTMFTHASLWYYSSSYCSVVVMLLLNVFPSNLRCFTPEKVRFKIYKND